MSEEATTLNINDLPVWRMHRLAALAFLIDLDNKNILRLIESISDKTGYLTVEWKVNPSDDEMDWVSNKWGQVGEDESNTIHMLNGKKLFQFPVLPK